MSELKLLEEVGPSEYGSSRLKAAAKCLQLYAHRKYRTAGTDSRNVLTLGAGVHYATAHHYLRMQQRQRGQDITWEEPVRAVRRASVLGIIPAMAPEQLDLVERIYTKNWNPNQVRGPEVLAVEAVLPIEFGPLNCPGHPDHGKPIRYDSRLDLVTARDNKVFITDSKTASSPSRVTFDGYRIDWQFIMMAVLGIAHYGKNFGGIYVQILRTTEPYDVQLEPIHVSPHVLQRAPQRYVELAHTVARLELETLREERTPFDWPAAYGETTCVGRYGACDYYELCFRGPARK